MTASNSVKDPVLERQGKRMIGPAIRFIAIGVVLAIIGIVLILIGHGWGVAFGILALLLGGIPGTIGFGLLSGGAVARWASRHKLFA